MGKRKKVIFIILIAAVVIGCAVELVIRSSSRNMTTDTLNIPPDNMISTEEILTLHILMMHAET